MPSLVKILILAAFLNGLSWIVLIPIWQYPDEQSHFAQVQGIAETGKVPDGGFDTSYEITLSEKILDTERDGLGNNSFTYHPYNTVSYSSTLWGLQEASLINLPPSARKEMVKSESTHNPPLYYFLAAAAYKVVNQGSLFTRIYAGRFVSLLLFTLTVYVTYLIAKLFFEKNILLQITLVSLVSFLPMFVFASTGILPDPLTNLLFSAILLTSLKLLKEGLSSKYILVLLSTIFAGVLTRQQFLISIPIIVFPLIYCLFRNPKYFKKILIPFLSVAVLIYISSLFIKDLIFIKSLRVPELTYLDLGVLFRPQFFYYAKSSILQGVSQTLPWYFGVYKWLSLTVPHVYYQIINRVILVSIIGLVAELIIIIKNKSFDFKSQALLFFIYSSIVYFLTLFVWDYFFQYYYGYSFGFQGRYYFPLIIAHMAILLTGMWTVFRFVARKLAKYLLLVVVFSVIAFNDASLSYVTSSYIISIDMTTIIRQLSQYKPVALKGDIMIVIVSLALVIQAYFILKFSNEIVKNNNESN